MKKICVVCQTDISNSFYLFKDNKLNSDIVYEKVYRCPKCGILLEDSSEFNIEIVNPPYAKNGEYNYE